MSVTAKQKKQLKVAEASAAYLVESQQARHSGVTTNPGTLSACWHWSTLGDVAEIVGGGTPKTDRADYFGGEIPWITPADLSGYTEKFISRGARNITQTGLENSGARLMPAGAVLFSSRAPIGYVAIAANPVSTNQGFKSFILRDALTPDYVYYYLQHAKKLAVELASGTTFLEISGKKAAQIPIPVPPLDEQHQIVAEIEKQFTRLEAGIAALRRVQANLKRYRAAVLKAACEGRLVPTEAELARKEGRAYESADQLLARILNERREKWTGRGKYMEPGTPETANLDPLPAGWTWAGMRQVGEVQLGRQRAPQHHRGNNMRPYLRVANVFEARIDTGDVMSMNFTPEEFEKYRLRDGDILLNEGQTPELVGRPAMFRDEVLDCCYQKTLLRFRAYDGLLPDFALTLFRSYMHNRRFTRAASITTNIAHLTAEKFVRIEFPLPPLVEQERIVAEVERLLSVVDEQESVVSANLQRATRLRQSILRQAFSGNCLLGTGKRATQKLQSKSLRFG